MIAAYHHLWGTVLLFRNPFFLALFFVVLLTPLMIFLAHRFNILDHPNERKLHSKPVPRLGGLGILIAFWAAALFHLPWNSEFTCIMLGGSIIAVMGIVDDIRGLSSVVRLGGQLLASAIVMSSGLIVSFMPHTPLGTLIAWLITLLWIIGIINALNFMDGLDGLASGMTMIAAFFFFLMAVYLRQLDVALLGAVLMGSAAGFLFYNFKPAKIYLGDGGSTFFGFMLACLALYGGWSNDGFIVALGVPTIILGVLVFDMIYITVSRIKNGEVKTFRQWLDYTGRDHFHHRLLSLGFSEVGAVLFIYLVCFILGLNVLVLERLRNPLGVGIQFFNAMLIFLLILSLMRTGRVFLKKKK
jgi:UDP-GlcNAc:undecaprenyl-phosphate/decaprenyl-phosphate GlcNAc-1-phosphate transferase